MLLGMCLFCHAQSRTHLQAKGSRGAFSGKHMDLPNHAVKSIPVYTSYYTSLFTALLSIDSSDIHRIKKRQCNGNIKRWDTKNGRIPALEGTPQGSLTPAPEWMAHTGIKPTTVTSLTQSYQLSWVTIFGFKGKKIVF